MRMSPHQRALGVAVVAVVAVVAGSPAALGGPGAAPVLPDLDQEAPSVIGYDEVGVDPRRKLLLTFKSAVFNRGPGAMVVRGHRATTAEEMQVDQLLGLRDGSTLVVGRIGTLRYVSSEDHSHWHLLDFERYELRSAERFRPILADRKTGFCLGDRYRPAGAFPGRPNPPPWARSCNKDRPASLVVNEGISVGYGDDYAPRLEGQHLDITDVPNGRYVLVHRVNVDRRMREASYSNNAASLLLSIRWPQGFRDEPRIRVLATCPDSARCTTTK